MPKRIKLYHNPRCSKSRQTLALLQDNDVEPEIILYLQSPLAPIDIKELLTKLEIPPRELLRKGEEIYKTLELKDATLSDQKLISAMSEHPILIERPIVETDTAACIGRPPENVLKLL